MLCSNTCTTSFWSQRQLWPHLNPCGCHHGRREVSCILEPASHHRGLSYYSCISQHSWCASRLQLAMMCACGLKYRHYLHSTFQIRYRTLTSIWRVQRKICNTRRHLQLWSSPLHMHRPLEHSWSGGWHSGFFTWFWRPIELGWKITFAVIASTTAVDSSSSQPYPVFGRRNPFKLLQWEEQRDFLQIGCKVGVVNGQNCLKVLISVLKLTDIAQNWLFVHLRFRYICRQDDRFFWPHKTIVLTRYANYMSIIFRLKFKFINQV